MAVALCWVTMCRALPSMRRSSRSQCGGILERDVIIPSGVLVGIRVGADQDVEFLFRAAVVHLVFLERIARLGELGQRGLDHALGEFPLERGVEVLSLIHISEPTRLL